MSPVYPTLVTRWLDTRQTPRSRANAEFEIGRWLAWCQAQELDWARADADDIMRHGAEKRARGNGPTTVATTYGVICGLYHWMWEAGHRADDASARVKRPRRPRSADRVWLGRTDLLALLDHVAASDDAALSAATHLWGYSGPRTGETLRIDVADISQHEGRMTVALCRSKGADNERITVPAETAREILRAIDGRTSGPLLRNALGERLSPTIARKRLARACRAAGVPVVTPQGLRISVITLALEVGIEERYVAIGVGHESSARIVVYDRLRAMIERALGVLLAERLRAA